MFSLSDYVNSAENYMKQNKFLDAAANFQRALQLNPNDAHIQLRCATAFNKAGKYKDAITYYQHVVTLDPNTQNIFHLIAEAYTELNDYKQAIIYFEKQLQQNQAVRTALRQSDIQANFKKGMAHVENNELDVAKTCFEKVLAEDPIHFDALFNMGMLCEKQKNYAETLDYYDRAYKLKPDNTPTLNNAANVFYNQKLYQPALELFELALQNINIDDDRHLVVLTNKVRALNELKRGNEACALLYQQAQQLEQQNKKPLALKYYDRLHDYFPKHRDSWIAKAKIFYNNTKDIVKTKECLETMLKYNSLDFFALYNLAFIHRVEKSLDSAKKLHKKIHKNHLQDKDSEFEYALLLTEQKRYRKAIRCFSYILKTFPNQLVALEKMAAIHIELKQIHEAFHCYAEIIQRSNEPTMRVNALYQQGNLYKQRRNIDKAQTCFEQALELNPNHAEALYALGIVYYEKKQMDQAYDYIYRAVGLGFLKIDSNIMRELLLAIADTVNPSAKKPTSTQLSNDNNVSHTQQSRRQRAPKKALHVQELPTQSLIDIMYDQPALPTGKVTAATTDNNDNAKNSNLERRKSM